MALSPEEWIAFEAAGCLIDGPGGWDYDHSSHSRPRAEAFLKFASDGVLRTTALRWTVCKDGKTEVEPSEQDKSHFLTMLFSRIKARKDELRFEISYGHKVTNIFKVADDINGHYEAARIELNHDRQKGLGHRHSVTGLRFHRADIESLFTLAEPAILKIEIDQKAKGGRPAAADWEAAALEMARRYYRDELKLGGVGDVKKQLTEWLASRNKYPGETALREHARRYFNSFSSWDDE